MFAGMLTQMHNRKLRNQIMTFSFDINYAPSIMLENWNKTQSVVSESLKPEGRGKYIAYCYLTLSSLPVPVQQNMSI